MKQNTSRAYGNVQLRYDLGKSLNFTYKIGFDNYAEEHIHEHNKGAVEFPLGFYRTTYVNRAIWDHSMLASYNTRLTDDITLNVEAGANAYINNYKQFGQYSSQQLVFDLLTTPTLSHRTKLEIAVMTLTIKLSKCYWEPLDLPPLVTRTTSM